MARTRRTRNRRKTGRRMAKMARTRNRRNTRHAVQRSLGLAFPDKLTMTHHYTEQTFFNPATGAYNYYTWSCNDMYDPNVTGTGHQPYYFDQLSAIYNHYTVIGSRIKLTFIPVDVQPASGNVPANIGVFINDNSTFSQTGAFQTLAEFARGNGQSKWICAGTTNNVYLNAKWSAKHKFGSGVLANNALRGASAGSPTEQQYYSVWFYNAHPTSTATVLVAVDIEYIAVWTERKDAIAGS